MPGAALDPADCFDEVVVVLLAAGSGQRLGSTRPKAFVGLAGEVLLAHSLRAFEQHDAVDAIVLVVPEGWVEPAEVLVDDLGCDRVSAIEVGGDSRAASVLAGLAAVPHRRQTAVLVHDTARPVVPADVVDRVLSRLPEGFDAVVPVLPVPDTVKRVEPGSGVVRETLVRAELRLAQTPQACRASVLHAALAQLQQQHALHEVTDDAHAVERAGGRTTTVAGDERLRKVTTAADLRALEAQLAPVRAAAGETAEEDDHPHDDDPLDEHDLAGFDEEDATQ